MLKQTVLITGANKSIGLETARRLGELGYRIWLGSRDPLRGEVAAQALRERGYDIRVLQIDVTSDDSVRNAAERVKREDGQLDVLINNAGILGDTSTPGTMPLSAIQEVYNVNVFGPIRTTQAFLPLLGAAPHANIVMVSSGLGSLGWLSDPNNEFAAINILGYNSSKSALNAVMLSFAKELAASGIRVNAADPGYTKTDFNQHSGYRTVEQAAEVIVRLATLDRNGPTAGYFDDRGVIPW
ncbi:SDR family oxidoreductase [Pseudomonas gingeri]|uniref:SDR family oxidoreductase n=1 Tax=Pseudomonas gingeri TaxID=117681 RepID=A0A7Y8C3A9_9PSED|nr:SDR family oxidoreductase [Pseudomonas gingeri]NWB98013.1 SDR family oxidoreductase [Pseudomonas gingeri]